MKDRTGKEIKKGDFVMFHSGSSMWNKIYVLDEIGNFYLVDYYSRVPREFGFEDNINKFNPMDIALIGNDVDNPELFFATYMKHRNENLDYKITIKDTEYK